MNDRRKAQRFLTNLLVEIRFDKDGTPIDGESLEISPNGMRILTTIPLIEASYVLINFRQASNNTHCEGRVVWTKRSAEGSRYESGVDIQRWGGGTPGGDSIENMDHTRPKKDRRRRPRSIKKTSSSPRVRSHP